MVKILDSDHWIALLRGTVPIEAFNSEEVLGITSISVAELTHGAYQSKRVNENLSRLDILLSLVDIYPFDEWAARHFGLIKSELEQRGTPLSDLDLQIASIAITHDAVLVTHNTKHFQNVPALILEDWL